MPDNPTSPRVPLRILIVEDSDEDTELMLLELSRAGLASNSRRVATAEQMRAALTESPWDIVLSDNSLPGFGAVEALALLREADPVLPFVVVSGTIGEDRAVEMMRAGAADYLLKNNLARLAAVVEREVREAENRRARRRAEQLASQLAAVVQSSVDAILAKTLEGIITSWNPAAERLFGWSATEAIGRHISFLVPPERIEELARIMTQLRRGERIEHFETVRLHRDGTRLDVSLTISPVRDDQGRLVGVSKIARDITARKQAEKALQTSEERFRTLVSATSAIVWNTSAAGEFETEQPGWTAFTGQTFDQLKGWGWLNAIHPDDRDYTNRVAKVGVAERTGGQLEYRLRRADGMYRRMSVRAVPILSPGGELREWVGVATDVHDHREAEIDRIDLLKRLNLHIERMPLAYIFWDTEVRIREWNPAAERIFGYRKDEILGRSAFETIVPESLRADVDTRVRRVLGGDMDANNVNEARTKDGRIIFCEWFNTPITNESGAVIGGVSLAADITEQRSLEAQFRQAQKMEAIGLLAGGIAHDFNNLLCVINGYSDLLIQELPTSDPAGRILREIRSAGEQSAALTRQLLAFSRKEVISPKPLNLNTVVADTETMLRRVIGTNVQLVTSLAGELGSVRADESQLQQVLVNFAVNARDAMSGGGRLFIETRNVDLDAAYSRSHVSVAPGEYVLLSVSDNGSGMSPEVRSRIFEPFFTTKGPGKGTGLGLAVVYGIVEQAGGHIDVASEVGIGTTFKIYWPRIDQGSPTEKSLPGIKIPPRGNETILLVEDDDGVRFLTMHLLKGFGYTVLEAASGVEALRITGQHTGPVHLLMTDVVMPGLSGPQVAENLAILHPAIRVLFVSGYTDDAVAQHGFVQDKVHFLPKPYLPVDLACKVREVLDSPGNGENK